MREKKRCPACGGAMEYERLVRMEGWPDPNGDHLPAFPMELHICPKCGRGELYLPQEGENPMDDRSVAFVLEGGHVPEQYRNCEIVPMALFDLYGISFLVHRQYQENDLIQAMVRHFTGKD